MIFPTGGPIPRHPSQIYQALLEGLVLFVVHARAVARARRSRARFGCADRRVPGRLRASPASSASSSASPTPSSASCRAASRWASCCRCRCCWSGIVADRSARRRPCSRRDRSGSTRFMARANAAYYATHDPFADFTTAPEITQVFGELLGALGGGRRGELMGGPDPVLLAEAGPGPRHADGATRCARSASVAPEFRAALRASGRDLAAAARAAGGAAARRDLARRPRRRCRPARCCCSPTNSSTRCRSASSSAAATAGRERFVADGGFVEQPIRRRPTLDARRTARWSRSASPRAPSRAALGARLARAGRGGAVPRLRPGRERARRQPAGAARRAARPIRCRPRAAPTSPPMSISPAFAAAARAAGAAVHGPLPQGVFLARLGLFQRTDRSPAPSRPRRPPR